MAFWRRPKDDRPNDQSTSDQSASDQSTSDASPSSQTPSDRQPGGDSANTGGVFSKLQNALTRSRQTLNTDIRDLFKKDGRLVDDQFLTDLFGRLIRTDMGVVSAEAIRDAIGKKHRARMVHFDEIVAAIAEETAAMLAQQNTAIQFAANGPTIILVVGVNGSGKTTSIAKLASHLSHDQGKTVVLGAGDTFRAAAVEQLTVWAGRIGCEIVTGPPEADPASIAFKTVQKAIDINADVAIIDTAGRLQTQTHLMSQLEKIRRVITKKIEDAPHEVLLVLDATAGQNAINQAQGFSEAAGCTGVVLAKLDGSAKGGVILPIREQFQLPVKFIGVGEQVDDLEAFDPHQFANGLFSPVS